MEANEFQEASKRTVNPDLSESEKILNWCFGIAGESGEFVDLMKKHLFHWHELNKEKAALELGDILYYVANAATWLGISLEEIMQMNVDKLFARYPEGFTQFASANRVEAKNGF